jgi:hypothetical protein
MKLYIGGSLEQTFIYDGSPIRFHQNNDYVTFSVTETGFIVDALPIVSLYFNDVILEIDGKADVFYHGLMVNKDVRGVLVLKNLQGNFTLRNNDSEPPKKYHTKDGVAQYILNSAIPPFSTTSQESFE